MSLRNREQRRCRARAQCRACPAAIRPVARGKKSARAYALPFRRIARKGRRLTRGGTLARAGERAARKTLFTERVQKTEQCDATKQPAICSAGGAIQDGAPSLPRLARHILRNLLYGVTRRIPRDAAARAPFPPVARDA